MKRTLTIPQLLNDANINTLVELDDVQFTNAAINSTYYDPNNVSGGATNHFLTDANGNTVTSDWLRRPTDRRANLAVIFQDRLKQNPSIRVNLSMVIGTNIPYYLDGMARYSNTPSIVPPYRRVDIGFSKTLREPGSKSKKYSFIKQSWLSIDVFNLLDINNVIAYSWVKDLENNRYGVPEYLTGRRLNVRFFLGF